jgi:hypothetical protein
MDIFGSGFAKEPIPGPFPEWQFKHLDEFEKNG